MKRSILRWKRTPAPAASLDTFEETFPPGQTSIFDVLSLMTPDELEEVFSDDYVPTPETAAALRQRLVDRAALVREAEALASAKG